MVGSRQALVNHHPRPGPQCPGSGGKAMCGNCLARSDLRTSRFQKHYFGGLRHPHVTEEKAVTFIYAASDEERNSAVALKEFLERGKQ